MGGAGAEIGRPVRISVETGPVPATLGVRSVREVDCTDAGQPAPPGPLPRGDGVKTGSGLDTSCLPPGESLRHEPYLPGAGYEGVVTVDTADTVNTVNTADTADTANADGTLVYRPDNLSAGNQGWCREC
jgi:hypothetical protein